MRRALTGLGMAALAVVLALGVQGALFGGALATAELRRAPAALAAVALVVLLRGPRALTAAAGWAVLGAAGAVLLRNGAGFPAQGGWIPGEATSRAETLCEVGWLAVIAAASWRGMAGHLAGPLLGAVVATTRIGGYGQALVPILWEDSVAEAVPLAVGVVAGLAAGLAILMLGGWCVAILARVSQPWVRPGRMLAALAVAASVGHMVRS